VFLLILENWCWCKERKRRPWEKGTIEKLAERCWISITNGSFHFFNDMKWVNGWQKKRERNVGKIIVLGFLFYPMEQKGTFDIRWVAIEPIA
jgi:hypothetical protein